MIRLGMVGKVLIHNYPYGAYFNGTDAELLEERCTKRWMLELIRGRFAEPAAKGSRITHVWACSSWTRTSPSALTRWSGA